MCGSACVIVYVWTEGSREQGRKKPDGVGIHRSGRE